MPSTAICSDHRRESFRIHSQQGRTRVNVNVIISLIQRVASETDGVGYDTLMDLADQNGAERDDFLLAAESLANKRNPRLLRAFVDRESGRDLPEEEISQRLGLAAKGDATVLHGVDLIYRSVSRPD